MSGSENSSALLIVHQEPVEVVDELFDDTACLLETAAEEEVDWTPPAPATSQPSNDYDVIFVKDTIYECGWCGKVFKTLVFLKRHLHKVHDGEGDWEPPSPQGYACEICKKCFKSKGNRDIHLENVHAEGYNFACSKCGKQFRTLKYLKAHVTKVHVNEKGYLCPICQKSFSVKGNRDMHCENVHAQGSNYSCETCGKLFKSQKYLNAHCKNVHVNGKPTKEGRIKSHLKENSFIEVEEGFACCICCKVFATKKFVGKHIMNVHGDQNYECFCGKSFKVKFHLKRHIETHALDAPHNPDRLRLKEDVDFTVENEGFACSICKKIFSSRRSLGSHVKGVHSGQVFECFCGKSFMGKQRLRRHMDRHTQCNSFPCDMCGKSFKSQNYLDTHHRKMHVDQKPLHCPFCQKVFSLKKFLDVHLLNVHGANYQCEACGDRFSSKTSAKVHVKKYHKPILPDGCLTKIRLSLEECVDYTREDNGYCCATCGALFSSKLSLRHHIKRLHCSQVFDCYCGKSYKFYSRFAKHMQSNHSDQNKKKCDKCNYQTEKISHLRRHMIIYHLTVNNDATSVKKRQFSKQVKTEKTRLFCACGENFKSKARLAVHMKYHFSECHLNVIPCGVCGKEFRWSHELENHMVAEHLVKCEHCKQKHAANELCVSK